MRHPLIWVVIAAALSMGGLGADLLLTAASPSVVLPEGARTPGLIAGLACLVLAAGLLAFTVWVSGRGGRPPGNGMT